jgi:hypothetical protein
MNPKRPKVTAIFRLFVDNRGVMLSSYAVIVSLLAAVVAISESSLETGEALISVALLSLGLWGGLYLTASWLAAGLPFPIEIL